MNDDSRDRQRQNEIDDLLEHLYRQSRKEPERVPFWRERGWRCELHIAPDDGTARLRVFNRDRMVHEEPTEPGGPAETRVRELKERFRGRID